MDELFTSDRFRLQPDMSPFYREELSVSPSDAQAVGISEGGQFALLAIQPLFPGPLEQEFAVRVVINPAVGQGTLRINSGFLDSTGLRPDDERLWLIRSAPNVLSVQEALIESVVEQDHISREIESLRRQRRELLVGRCLLVEPGQTVKSLALPLSGRGYFNFRAILPPLNTVSTKAVLVFNENTRWNLFVPHRKGAVDIVILVDGSGSMDLEDYVGRDDRPHARIEGVRDALEILFHRRLISGTRLSRIAVAVFGGDTKMLYPLQKAEMVELRQETQLATMRSSVRDLSRIGLERLGVDRNHTNISQAMQYAAELLNYYSEEGNERAIILLSDGAHWEEKEEKETEGEIITTAHDPAVLADSLHHDSEVRIHTVAISNEQAFRRWVNANSTNIGWIPNTKLLDRIATSTDGLFIESPDARALAKLFDELGEGTIYQVFGS
jgi:hypothetical protein